MSPGMDTIRHLLDKLPLLGRGDHASRPQDGPASPKDETPTIGNPANEPEPATNQSLSPSEGRNDDVLVPGLARLMSTYLNAKAEEMLALLIEGLTKEALRDVSRTMESSRQILLAEIGTVRGEVNASQKDLARIGRELVRSGATMESLQAAMASIGPAIEEMENSLRAELAQHRERREEENLAGLDELMATLDGLEAGLAEGRRLLQAAAEAQRRLQDTTVQRWWRAMNEATGVKRRLPEVPLDDLESLVSGLELTYRRLQDALARRGVTPIEAVGQPFDPHVHEAVAVEACPEEQDGLVLREERKGYRTADHVVRLSQVIVGRTSEKGKKGSGRAPAGTEGSSAKRDRRGGRKEEEGKREGDIEND